jgi:hypothetical protein
MLDLPQRERLPTVTLSRTVRGLFVPATSAIEVIAQNVAEDVPQAAALFALAAFGGLENRLPLLIPTRSVLPPITALLCRAVSFALLSISQC